MTLYLAPFEGIRHGMIGKEKQREVEEETGTFDVCNGRIYPKSDVVREVA